MMAPKGHALPSASSSDRWLHCPPSARLCESYDDKGSDYAARRYRRPCALRVQAPSGAGHGSDRPTESLKWWSEEMNDCAIGLRRLCA